MHIKYLLRLGSCTTSRKNGSNLVVNTESLWGRKNACPETDWPSGGLVFGLGFSTIKLVFNGFADKSSHAIRADQRLDALSGLRREPDLGLFDIQ